MMTGREKELMGYLQDVKDGEVVYDPLDLYDICNGLGAEPDITEIAVQLDIGTNEDVQKAIRAVLKRLGYPESYFILVSETNWLKRGKQYKVTLKDKWTGEKIWEKTGPLNKAKWCLMMTADPDYEEDYDDLRGTLRYIYSERQLRLLIKDLEVFGMEIEVVAI